MKWMTYEQVVAVFEENIKPLVIEQYGDDYIAMREAFNDYTDMLCKDGSISNNMYNDMDNPY